MKKTLMISCLVIMLLMISFASAVEKISTKKERSPSPLWGVRTERTIGEKLYSIIESIKTKFIGERLFFIPFQSAENHEIRSIIKEVWKEGHTLSRCGILTYGMECTTFYWEICQKIITHLCQKI